MSTMTNGRDVNSHEPGNGVVRSATRVRWIRPTDLPAYLGDALVPDKIPDESSIWGEQMPDPDALEKAVDRAKRTVALQDVGELVRAKSPQDIAADLEAERELRDLERARKLKQRQAEIAEAEARDAHDQRMRELARQAQEAAADASATADALTNPHHEVVRLHRARRWVPALAAVPAVFALIAGAVNVGSQLHRLFPHTPLVAWVIDPIITLAIVAIGAAHLYDVVRPRNAASDARIPNPFRRVEVFLFVLTSVAAVALHYPDGPGPDGQGADDASPLIWLSIPIGLGVSLWLVPQLRGVFTDRLREARAEARRYDAERARERAGKTSSEEGLHTPSDLHEKNLSEEVQRTSRSSQKKGRRATVSATIPEPNRKTVSDHRKTLRALVEAGEIDPRTVSVNAAKNALACHWSTARDLLVQEYGRTDLIKN